MSYYKAGDYGGGGYYRGYYSAGGFFDKLGAGLHKVLSSPVAQAASMFVPGIPGLVLKSATTLASHTNIIPESSGTTPGALTAAPSVASMPGHSTQTITSGGMMASHVTHPPPSGTPGTVANDVGLSPGGHRARARHRRRSSRRAHAHRRGGARRSRRRSSRGDVRRASSGRFLTGHHFAKRHRRGRRGGTVSFVTKDGRRVSFKPRGDAA